MKVYVEFQSDRIVTSHIFIAPLTLEFVESSQEQDWDRNDANY